MRVLVGVIGAVGSKPSCGMLPSMRPPATLARAALLCALLAAPASHGTPKGEAHYPDPIPLLRAAVSRDAFALDRLAEAGPPALRGPAAVARIGTLTDPEAAHRAALAAGFVTGWSLLGPLPGGARTLDRVGPALEDWIEGRKPAQLYPGAAGPVAWRPVDAAARFGRLDVGALVSEAPGVLLARAGFGLAEGGSVVAWVYSAAPWRLWIDGAVVGGGFGHPDLRRAEPVPLTLAPGGHRALIVTHAEGPPPAIALRIGRPDGAPLPVAPRAGEVGPHPVALGALPGRPTAVVDPLSGTRDEALPLLLAPPSAIDTSTPEGRAALLALAPDRAGLWRQVAEDREGDAARAAWARAAALDPFDLDALRRADPAAWPAPARAFDAARRAPPADFAGPAWWARVDDRVAIFEGGALIEQRQAAARVLDPAAAWAAGALPTAPDDADARAWTVLRGESVRPLAGPPSPRALRPGDVLVVSWRRSSRDAAAHVAPPPAPFGRWTVTVEAAEDAPVRVVAPAGVTVARADGRRRWTLEAEGAARGPVAAGALIDEDALAIALSRRLPPVPPARVPDPGARAATIEVALRRSSRAPDRWSAAEVLVAELARAGWVADPVFARPRDVEAGPIPSVADWPIPLVALDDTLLDPTHPDGARPASLQGAPARRIGPDGGLTAMTLPVDPPARHALVVRGELRLDGQGALLAVHLERRGRSPLDDAAALLAGRPGVEVLEVTADRVTARLPLDDGGLAAAPVFAVPEAAPSGPAAIESALTVLVPEGAAFTPPPDVSSTGPAGHYRRSARRSGEGWLIERSYAWTGGEAPDAAAFHAAAVAADRARMGLRGGAGGGE